MAQPKLSAHTRMHFVIRGISVLMPFIVAVASGQDSATSDVSTSQKTRNNWEFKTVRDKMDDVPRYYLQLDANEPVAGVTPTLVIRCDAPKQTKDGWGRKRTWANADVLIVTHLPLHGQETHMLRVRFDEDKAQTEPWRDAESLDAIFHETGTVGGQVRFVNRIASAKTMKVEFTPFLGTPVVATFSVTGLAEKLKTMNESCGWTP